MPRKYRRFLSFIIIVAKISKHKYRIQLFKAIIPFVKEELTCLINLLESGEFDENIQIVNSTWKHALLKTLGTTYIVTSLYCYDNVGNSLSASSNENLFSKFSDFKVFNSKLKSRKTCLFLY